MIGKADSTNGFGVTVPIGHRLTADAPVQRKALLAWQPEEAIQAWLEGWRPIGHTGRSITDRETLLADLAATRARGYAVSREESVVGVTSAGLPIFDRAAHPMMVLQCPALTETLSVREQEVAAALQQAIMRAHVLLSSRVPESFRFP